MPLLKQNLNKKCFKWIFRVCQKRKLRLCWVCKLQRDNDWRRVISSSVLVSIFASLHVRLHRSHHLANFSAGGFIDNLVSLCQASRLIQVGRHYVKIPSWLSHSCSSWTAVLVPLTVKTIHFAKKKILLQTVTRGGQWRKAGGHGFARRGLLARMPAFMKVITTESKFVVLCLLKQLVSCPVSLCTMRHSMFSPFKSCLQQLLSHSHF